MQGEIAAGIFIIYDISGPCLQLGCATARYKCPAVSALLVQGIRCVADTQHRALAVSNADTTGGAKHC